MCGIVGVLAERAASGLIMDALRRLEYRGYDSAGVATLENGALTRRRAVGKLGALEKALEAAPLEGSSGVGHTRWATHGAPTEANAHPHVAGPVAVVHNGIIENHAALRAELEREGRVFETATDTETIAHLCAHLLGRGLSPVDAASATIARLEGAFALCFLFDGAPDLLVCARRGSPLAIGWGDGEMFVGSDALALAAMTNRISYLEDGDWAAVARDGARVFDSDGMPVDRPVRNIPLEAALVGKDGHRHFMAKEIHEQPTTLAYAIAAAAQGGRVSSPADGLDWAALDSLPIIACGTAAYAGHVAKYWFESVARLPVDIDVASEFRYRAPPMRSGGAAVFVSQSGETADTLAALRYARAQDQTVISVVNVESSTIAREADIVIPIHAGPEIGVASTKAFTGQLVALAVLALSAARARGTLNAPEEARLVGALLGLPRLMTEVLAREEEVAALARDIASASDVLYLGRGPLFPLALEGALKLKELTYIHAEGYAAGELKHGPIALIDDTTPVIALAPHDRLHDKMASNIQEVLARKGRVAMICDAAAAESAPADVWRILRMPEADPFVAPILYAAPAQLLAYHAAVQKGTDVDQPRNLAKSVTVE